VLRLIGGVVLESAVPVNNRFQAGVDAINAGLRDLWILGTSTSQHTLTGFLSASLYPVEQLTTRQRVALFMPVCVGANPKCYLDCEETEPICTRLLFAPEDGTKAACVIGQLNADWDYRHEACEQELADSWVSASEGEPAVRVLWRSAIALGEAGYERYARGLVMLGGHVKSRRDESPSQVEVVGGLEGVVSCRVVPNPVRGAGLLQLSLPGTGLVSVDLVDVGGRRVQSVFRGDLSGGAHEIPFESRGARGVLWAVVRWGTRAEVRKLIVLQ